MINTLLTYKQIVQLIGFVTFVLAAFVFTVPNAYAATVELSVNGGSTAAIVNGEDVLLEWEIDGAVSNCVINNGVGPIDTSSLPVFGSMTVTPPEGATTDYTLTCTGGTSVATVAINPTVNLVADELVVERDVDSGEAKVDLDWDSRFATECSAVWLVEDANPGVPIWSTSHGDQYETSGDIEFDDDNSQPPITRDATYYIECTNIVTGASTVASVSVSVIDPAPLPPPTANIESDEPGGATTVTRDSLTASADVELYWNSNSETDQCAFQAYYLDGTPYAEAPAGFDRYGNPTYQWAGTFYVDIYESTRFEVTCTNFAYSLGGVDYPEESAVADVTITVDPPLPIDRTGQPQVTMSATVLESTVNKIPGTDYGQVVIDIEVANAEGCDYWASGTGGARADGWWGQDDDGTKSETIFVNVNVGTTTLQGQCERYFDTTNFSPGDPEYDAAIADVTLEVVVIDTGEVAPSPVAYIFGNANYLDATDMWDTSTADSGFCRNSGSGSIDASLRSPNCSGGDVSDVISNGTVTFPFVSPDQDSDTYDLTVKYCDESDGFNDFTITTESGFTTTWRSDSITQPDTWCSPSNEITKVIGTDVLLEDGELITISCNNAADPLADEQCILMGLAVGQEDGGSLTYNVSTSTGFAEVPIYWASEYADDCYDPIATLGDGTTYEFVTDTTPTDRFLLVDLSTTTNLSIGCDSSSGDDTSSIDIIIDGGGGGVVVATTSIDVFECYDPALPGVRDTEVWEWANPTNSNFCEPAVDLNALEPSISFADAIADNVAGLYDSLEALIAIQNLGPGPLLAGNEIEFLSRLEIDLVISTLFGVGTSLDSPSTPGFTDGLGQPPDPSDPTVTPVLTRTYDGVPFGTHELCARINVDGTDSLIFTEWNPDTTNNQICTEFVLPVPPPPMTLTAARDIIRTGQTVDISWEAHTSYPLTCEAIGPGGISETFDASANDPAPSSFIQTTGELTSTSKFKLTCTEPITNTIFIEEITVEVVPEQQEV